MTPRGHTIAYQIWAYANPRGWDCTIAECADAIGVRSQAVGKIAQNKGWTSRFRGNPETAFLQATFMGSMALGFVTNVTKLDRTDIPHRLELPE